MEMNATEKFHLPVDGIFEMFNSLTGHQQASMALPKDPQKHPPKVSSVSKRMGLIKTVRGCWRRQEKKAGASRSSSSGNRKEPTERLSKRSVDQLELGQTKPANRHRIVVLGAPKVGKTNVLRRFLGREFEERYERTTEDFHRKLFHIGGEAYQIDLLDAASERDFPAKRRLTILTGDIFLLVFSLDDRESLNEVCKLLGEIKAAKAKLQKLKHASNVPIVICGNKADLGPGVVKRTEVGKILGEGVLFFETSAKNDTGLDALFRALTKLGGLPDETSPSRHQVVPILTYQSLCVGRRGRRGSRTPGPGVEPCAAVDPLARRPSFNSDLRLVLGSSTKRPKPEKCHIQ